MRFGGGVSRTLGIGDAGFLAVFPLNGFSVACMLPPVLQAKLEINLRASE
jgi:hypothetical protein